MGPQTGWHPCPPIYLENKCDTSTKLTQSMSQAYMCKYRFAMKNYSTKVGSEYIHNTPISVKYTYIYVDIIYNIYIVSVGEPSVCVNVQLLCHTFINSSGARTIYV